MDFIRLGHSSDAFDAALVSVVGARRFSMMVDGKKVGELCMSESHLWTWGWGQGVLSDRREGPVTYCEQPWTFRGNRDRSQGAASYGNNRQAGLLLALPDRSSRLKARLPLVADD
jgi:hypothetical protein